MELLDRHPGWYEASGYEARDAILAELQTDEPAPDETPETSPDDIEEPPADDQGQEPMEAGDPTVIEDDEETP